VNRRAPPIVPLVACGLVAWITAASDVLSTPPSAPRGGQSMAATSPLAARTRGRTVTVHGQAVSASDYFAKTPPDTVVTLRSGQKATLGHLVDSYEKLDAALRAHGSSLDRLQKSGWVGGASPHGMQEVSSAVAAAAAQVAQASANPRGQVTYPQGDPNRAQAVKHDIDHSFFSISPYSHFQVGAADPAAEDGTTCSVSWNAGLKLYNTQFDVVKVVGTESTSRSQFLAATLQIYVMGNSEFAGSLSADGDPPFDKAISSSQLPGGEPSVDMDIVPNTLKVHAVAGGSAYFKLFPVADSGAVQSGGRDVGFYCSLDVKPTLRTEGHVRADAYVGPSFLGMPALTVSARGSLEPLLLDLPTTALVAVHDTPVRVGFGLKADLTTELMAGKLAFDWALADVCEGSNCVMADGLGIPTSGELASWDRPATVVQGPYVNVDAGLAGETLSSR